MRELTHPMGWSPATPKREPDSNHSKGIEVRYVQEDYLRARTCCLFGVRWVSVNREQPPGAIRLLPAGVRWSVFTLRLAAPPSTGGGGGYPRRREGDGSITYEVLDERNHRPTRTQR